MRENSASCRSRPYVTARLAGAPFVWSLDRATFFWPEVIPGRDCTGSASRRLGVSRPAIHCVEPTRGPALEFLFWTEVRVPDGRRPEEDVEWAKDTLTLLFLLPATWRLRRPTRACCARRSRERGGLRGLLRTSLAALVEGFAG